MNNDFGIDIRVELEWDHKHYSACDLNTYDGAIDGTNFIGHGKTKAEAVEELILIMEDSGYYDPEYIEAMKLTAAQMKNQ